MDKDPMNGPTQGDDERADLASYLKDSGYPLGDIEPKVQQPPRGPFGLDGGGLDSASLSVLQALQNAPRPRGFAQNALAGFAGGLAGGRARQANQRTKENDRAATEAKDLGKERRKAAGDYGRQLAMHRWQVQRETAKQNADTVDVPGVGRVPKTSRVALRHFESTGAVPKATVSTSLEESRQLTIDSKRREAEDAASDIEDTAAGIASVNFARSPILPARTPDRDAKINLANQMLAGPESPKKADGKPYTVRELEQLWNQAEQFGREGNRQRFTALRQAGITVRKHMDQLNEYYDKNRATYDSLMAKSPVLRLMNPGEFVALNKGMLEAGRNGFLGPQAAEDAAALLATVGAVSREASLVFSSGFAPEKEDILEARRNLSAAVGPRGHAGQSKALMRLIEARLRTAEESVPFLGGGRGKNPYLLDASPLDGWRQAGAEKAPVLQEKPKPTSGGKAGKYGN